MTEADKDKLITQFLKESRQEIPDNGFSRKVNRRLPDRARKLSFIWSTICTCLGLGIFIFFGGVAFALELLKETYVAFGSKVGAVNQQYMVIAAFVLGILGLYRVVSSTE